MATLLRQKFVIELYIVLCETKLDFAFQVIYSHTGALLYFVVLFTLILTHIRHDSFTGTDAIIP